MRIHYFQHVPFEGLGSIEDWIQSEGYEYSSTRFDQNDPLPELDRIDWLIIMGGPMGANDDHLYPWLNAEKKFIGKAIKKGIRILGICLGAQLIASVLGARVYPNAHKEIGWFPVRLTSDGLACPWFAGFPEEMMVFHWHGDTFDLPQGAKHLAESNACTHQAFLFGNHVLALQFHLDLTREHVEALIKNCGSELIHAPYIQNPEQMLAQDKAFEKLPAYLNRVLDVFKTVRRENK